MPSSNHTHASCNDFQFGYVPAPVPRAQLSKQNGPDSDPIVGLVGLFKNCRFPLKQLTFPQLSSEKQNLCAFLT